MGLIDAGVAERWMRQNNAVMDIAILKAIPTVDAVPAAHGRWENGNPICPVCGEDKFKDLDADIWCDWQPPYCPNCGAKMDLEDTGNNNANKEID